MFRLLHTTDWQLGMTRHFLSEGAQERYSQARFDAIADPDSPDVPRLEAEIDRQVYDIYGLTPDEIAIVEGKS